MVATSASSPELDLKCWTILRQYATTGMTLFETEQELENIFKDSIYAYDDSKWHPTINQIICIELDTDDEVPIINNIDEAIESLVMETYSQPPPPSPLLTSSTPFPHSCVCLVKYLNIFACMNHHSCTLFFYLPLNLHF